jgi:hypothetical protein
MSKLSTVVIGLLALAATHWVYQVRTTDYKPDRPNRTTFNNDIFLQVEKNFKDPRAVITTHNSMYSVLTREDGRKYLITSAAPGTYIDVTVKDGQFVSGTLLRKGDCVALIHPAFDNSHCH